MRQIRRITRMMTIMIALIVCFTMVFVIMPEESYAASKKPARVILTSVKSVDHNAIKITWKKAKNAKKYQVYRSAAKNGKYKLIKTTKSKTFTNKKLKTGKKYYYKVRAINGSQKGKFSAKKYAIPKLKRTTNVKIVATETIAKLSWHKVNGAKGYQVYRTDSKNGTYKKVKTTTDLSFTNENLTVNKGYYYKVRAYKKVNGKFKYGKFSTVKYIKTKDHSYNVVETVASTCTEKGYSIKECINCGDQVKYDYTAALGHNYAAGEPVAPTCTTKGYTEHRCTRDGCGASYKDAYKDALGHDWFVEKYSEGVYEEQCSRGCGFVQDHTHRLVAQYRDKTDNEIKQGYYEYTTVEYYGCQECKAQLLYSADGTEVNAFEVFADSDSAIIAKAQTAHNKFHAPDGVTPTYGIIVEESTEPLFVSQDGGKVLEGQKCIADGCDYFNSHVHVCTVPVEVATADYKRVSCTVDYTDRLNCPGCIETIGDFSGYPGSVRSAHTWHHYDRGEKDKYGNARTVYDVVVHDCVYRSVMTESDYRICSTDGCSYIY